MRSRDFVVFGLFGVLCCASALAHTQECPSSLGVAQQVVCLQERAAVLQQRLSNAQIEQTLSKLNGSATTARGLGLPAVAAIIGRGEHLRAMLAWQGVDGSSAGSLEVTAGDVLPGGYTVEKILPGRVVLADANHQRHVLLMNGGGGAQSTPAPHAAAVGNQPASAIPPVPHFLNGGAR